MLIMQTFNFVIQKSMLSRRISTRELNKRINLLNLKHVYAQAQLHLIWLEPHAVSAYKIKRSFSFTWQEIHKQYVFMILELCWNNDADVTYSNHYIDACSFLYLILYVGHIGHDLCSAPPWLCPRFQIRAILWNHC